MASVTRLRRVLGALAGGGSGVAFAVLTPRAASLGVQWLLAIVAGPAAVAAFVNVTSRGGVVVSLVSAGLAATLLGRRAALRSARGRALIGAALAALAALAFAVTLAWETALGLGARAGLITACFSALSLFSSVAPAVWPLWQMEGRYLRLLLLQLFFSPLAASLTAFLGKPSAVAIATGLASATPALVMVRPAPVVRTARYAAFLLRRAVPVSITNFATAVVFPLALHMGVAEIGGAAAGHQVLYWSFIVALSIASQSFATRAITAADPSLPEPTRRARALRAWIPAALALCVVPALLYLAFTTPIPGVPRTGAAREALIPTMLVSGVAPVLTDPICFYFSGTSSRRPLALGSAVVSALVALGLWLAPAPIIHHIGVIGPSALIGVLRLAFVFDPPARHAARVAGVALLAAYAAAVLLA